MLTPWCSDDPQVQHRPHFIKERLELFQALKEDSQALLPVREQEDAGSALTVRVAGGETVEGARGRTTPYQVAAAIR